MVAAEGLESSDARNIAKIYREIIMGSGSQAIINVYMDKLVQLSIDILSRTS